MSLLQFRINYNDNSLQFYASLLSPLSQLWRNHAYTNWSLARDWKHGPHYLLTLDTSAPNFKSAWVEQIQHNIYEFLHCHPSPACDVDKLVRLQKSLSKLEASVLDVEKVEENNSARRISIQRHDLAKQYESSAQWQSVFEAEQQLSALIMRAWLEAESHEQCIFELLTMLACVFPPQASRDPEIHEYNGFLSYYSNYVFWIHGLNDKQGEQIQQRFAAAYREHASRYQLCLSALETNLHVQHSLTRSIAQFLLEHYLIFLSLAEQEIIHARSPYSKHQIAEQNLVSDFHKKAFYNDDGSAYQFSPEFSAYRWLLNIVYKNLPLLNVSPLERQRWNYTLDRLHKENPALIGGIRLAMLAVAG